jgi:Family of unknown function (DUF5989)
MSFVNELWGFMRHHRKFWLLPVFMVMGLLGGLLVFTKSSAIAPFIYTIF